MNVRPKLSPEETASRILDVAEEHFRRVGYAKTAIADLAEDLGMSSANIYRYFPSKGAINEAICARMLAECEALMDRIMAGPGSAGERLRSLLLTIYAYNSRCYVAERRMHDMVAVAMEEDWGAVKQHIEDIVARIGRLIGEGVAAGEFRPVDDIPALAFTVKQATVTIMHPLNIAECMRHGLAGQAEAERLCDFVLLALKR